MRECAKSTTISPILLLKPVESAGSDDVTLCKSVEEVKAHNKPYDGWMILRGKVYNITPYLAYHPGGSEILERCLGKDASKLFDRYHQWVNIDGLIGTLLIGTLKANEMPCLGEDDEEDESSDEDCN